MFNKSRSRSRKITFIHNSTIFIFFIKVVHNILQMSGYVSLWIEYLLYYFYDYIYFHFIGLDVSFLDFQLNTLRYSSWLPPLSSCLLLFSLSGCQALTSSGICFRNYCYDIQLYIWSVRKFDARNYPVYFRK